MVKDFVDRVFDGASESLLVHLAKDARLSPRQRQALEKLVDDMED
jgi:predicted transcriptional regulator